MSQVYRLCEIAENNGRNGKPLWLIVKGNVYDLTEFIKDHPGGADIIQELGGKDATKAFNEVGHSADAMNDMKLYKVGAVSNECSSAVAAEKSSTDKCRGNNAANPQCCRTKKRFKFFFCF